MVGGLISVGAFVGGFGGGFVGSLVGGFVGGLVGDVVGSSGRAYVLTAGARARAILGLGLPPPSFGCGHSVNEGV